MSPECAAADLATALKSYSESRRGERKGKRIGFPKWKSRKASRQSFRLRHPAQVHVDGSTVTLPGLGRTVLGTVNVYGSTRRLRRMLEQGRFRPMSVTVSFEHHRWWISIAGRAAAFHTSRTTHARRDENGGARRPAKSSVPVGVDLGVRTLATAADADGLPVKVWKGVKALRGAQAKVRRANKALARAKPGSKGYRTTLDKTRRVHARVYGLREDLLHQVSTWLVDRHTTVVIEDLNVAGMLADRRLALGAADAAMATLRRLLAYKASWYGTDLIVADRWYPSSKSCSAPNCGHVHSALRRGEANWTCPACGTTHDRDHNAAVNLARWPAPNQPQAA